MSSPGDQPLVGVLMGSKSDQSLMQPSLDMLMEFGINHEVSVISAHRNPQKIHEYATSARSRGLQVIIAGAGAAAHLPGVIASWTTLPVIGVPLPTSDLKGLDSLFSITQMPGGIPVGCMAVGSAGAKNAAIFAAEILALKSQEVLITVEAYRAKLAEG